MEIKGAIIVHLQTLRDSICIKGTEPRDETEAFSKRGELFLNLPGVTSRRDVVRNFKFRRVPGPELFYSHASLLCNAHLKPDEEHDYRLLVEIPIRSDLPFIDLLDLGVYDNKIVYGLWTNMLVQLSDKHDRMFFRSHGLDELREAFPVLGQMVDDGIIKYKLSAV